ncbi:MAG: sensor histidine kinase, partial [Sphingobacteriales bacterium]
QAEAYIELGQPALALPLINLMFKNVFQDNLGRFYSEMANYDSAIFYYEASLQTQQAAGNKQGMATSYNNLGVAAQNIKANYTAAAEYYFKALNLLREIKDSAGQANTLTNLSAIYMLQQDYERALDFNKKALRIREQKGDLDAMAISLQSIGKTYLLMRDTITAKTHFQKGLSISESNGNIPGMAAAWSNLSLCYGNNYRAVAEARIKAKQLWNEVNALHPEAIANLGNLGIIYLDIVRYDSLRRVKYDAVIPDDKNILLQKAAAYLNSAIQLAEQTGDVDNYSFFKGALAEVQEQQGDYKNAYYNYKFFKEAEDSIYSQESKNKIAQSESKRTLELNQLALANQRRTLWVLVAGIGLIALTGFLLYRLAKARKKINQQLIILNTELDNANKAKVAFFALMSHDLRSPVSKLINFLHLQKNNPELLTPELKELHSKKITEGAEALLENMENMLLWSKSQMERFAASAAPVNIDIVFSKLKKSFSTDQAIEFIFINNTNKPLVTDENYLFSILHNLIQNATEILQANTGGKIECSASFEDGVFNFSIQDNGPGYPDTLIHNNFSNGNIVSAKKGLGLFMISDMAIAIKGNLHLQNTAKGALAELKLPA